MILIINLSLLSHSGGMIDQFFLFCGFFHPLDVFEVWN